MRCIKLYSSSFAIIGSTLFLGLTLGSAALAAPVCQIAGNVDSQSAPPLVVSSQPVAPPVPAPAPVTEPQAQGKYESLQCWKGFSDKDQKAGLAACLKAMKDDQVCDTNVFWHGFGAAYDVCLEGFVPQANQTVRCFKGLSQSEQNQNLALCRQQLSFGQVCETNLWIHHQAAYDVCIMD